MHMCVEEVKSNRIQSADATFEIRLLFCLFCPNLRLLTQSRKGGSSLSSLIQDLQWLVQIDIVAPNDHFRKLTITDCG